MYLHAVFAHNADIVAACLIVPVFFHIQGTELAKSVCGKENLVGAVVGYHDFRPVYHGGKQEGKLMPAQGKSAFVLDGEAFYLAVQGEKLIHHGKGFGIAHDGGIRVLFHKVLNVGGMVWLHMLYDQIVGCSAIQCGFHVGEPFSCKMDLYGVHDRNFFIQNDIRIVCHAIGHNILTLKQIHLVVVDSYIFDVICNFHTVFPLQGASPLSFIKRRLTMCLL